VNLTAPSEVKALLDRLDFRPSKVLGQNFLIDANILRIMLATAHLTQEDAVLEVGPGLGVLTEWLARWAGRVIAVEKDRRLFAHLRERFAGIRNLELVEGDALKTDLEGWLAGGVNKVVSNLPYSVASRLIFSLVESPHPPEQMVVTVQREVADRLAAGPGTKDYGLISVMTQLRYQVGAVKNVSPSCFLPAPDVWSAIVNLALRSPAPPGPRDAPHFKALIKTAFAQRRKQMASILRRGKATADLESILKTAGVDPRARPENLAPAQWVSLSDALAEESGRTSR
jgi:16S rRNA (adenine1518-N6/adenine1519-N6)-dimethyltransferase